jgi:diadenosine tetraphosphate (Ap4A) HIT family hydrolase
VSGPGCPACDGSWPAPAQRIAEFPLAVAYLHEDQFFPGWTCLVLRRHATELYHLTAAERSGLIEEVSTVARALAEEFDAVKMNYELLGNAVPHIHWHVVPRRVDDPAPRGPVWTVEHARKALAPAELAERVARIRRRLSG